MAPFIVQAVGHGSGGVWTNPIGVAFANPLQGGNALVGLGCARGICSTLVVTTSDTQANTWTTVDSSTYGLAYTLSSSAGADTVQFNGTGFCGFTYDPCSMGVELAGVTGFGSNTAFTGTTSQVHGSVTLAQGTYSFTSLTTYDLWILNMMYFTGANNNGIMLAFLYVPNENVSEDIISGWALQTENLHSSLYSVTVAPTPPATVRIFVNSGSSKPLSSFV